MESTSGIVTLEEELNGYKNMHTHTHARTHARTHTHTHTHTHTIHTYIHTYMQSNNIAKTTQLIIFLNFDCSYAYMFLHVS